MKLAPFLLAFALASCQQPLRSAQAQIQPGPNLTPNGRPFLFAPRHGYLGPSIAIPAVAPLPPIAAAPPPPAPPPLGWIFLPYTVCADPACGALFVAVGADGLNVRSFPNGPVLVALVNGTPVIPLQRSGPWALVSVPCNLAPTGLWSWTAGVSLGACL